MYNVFQNAKIPGSQFQFDDNKTACLVTDQRDVQILFYVFISIYNSLHVSNT